MEIRLKTLDFRYRLAFARPMVEIAGQPGRLLDELTSQLASRYTVTAADMRLRSGAVLADYGMRISMFNGLGSIDVTTEAIECAFKSLRSESDLNIAAEVTDLSVRALGNVLPKIAKSSEGVVADLVYDVQGGATERDKFFATTTFPGRGSAHFDIGFKFRAREPELGDTPISFDISPLWVDPTLLYIHLDAPLRTDASENFGVRAKKLVNFVETVISAMGVTLLPLPAPVGSVQ